MALVANILLGIYAVLPLVALGFGFRRWQRHGQRQAALGLMLACGVGALAGAGLVLLNGWLLEGRVQTEDAAKTIHLCVAAACAVKIADWTTMGVLCRLLGSRRNGRLPGSAGLLLSFLAQRTLMLALTLGYVFALTLAYRPRVIDDVTPASRKLEWRNESFAASDGIHLSGWFLPAAKAVESRGSTTILLCHGVGSRKQQQLDLARFLLEHGYNVMAFDFRGHGSSDGNSCSYGDKERLDVLAAARQLKTRYPQQAQRIVGVGTNTGAAALVLAAADEQGGDIDVLVLIEPFADFQGMAKEVAGELLPAGLRQVFHWVSLPMASWHVGARLNDLSPGTAMDRLWPRPVLVLHGRGQSFVPTLQEMDVYRMAAWPRAEFWPADNYRTARAAMKSARGDADLFKSLFRRWMGLKEPTADDAGVRARLLRFIEEAHPGPFVQFAPSGGDSKAILNDTKI